MSERQTSEGVYDNCLNCDVRFYYHERDGCDEYRSPIAPPAEPKCENCGHEKYKHYDDSPKCGQVGCPCDGYRPPTTEPAESEGPCEDCGHGKHAHSDHRCYSAGSVTQEECLCSRYHPPTPFGGTNESWGTEHPRGS